MRKTEVPNTKRKSKPKYMYELWKNGRMVGIFTAMSIAEMLDCQETAIYNAAKKEKVVKDHTVKKSALTHEEAKKLEAMQPQPAKSTKSKSVVKHIKERKSSAISIK